MAGKTQVRGDIVQDALRRFQFLPSRTVARYILHANGVYFDNDLEKIRSLIRYYRGAQGQRQSNWNWGFALVNVEKNGDFEVENRRILPSGKVV